MNHKEIINQWLFTADQHYISARLLFMFGLYNVALPNAATAVEMYLKCLSQLQGGSVKKFGHKLLEQFAAAKINLASELQDFIKELESSYQNKYPDAWKGDIKWKESLNELDQLIFQLRNIIIKIAGQVEGGIDLLVEIKNRGDLISEISDRYGMPTVREALFRNNQFIYRFKFLDKQ